MKTKEQIIKYWSGTNGLKHLYPVGQEDFYLGGMVKSMVSSEIICEVGCGDGRWACLFNPDCYLGIDINKEAIESATLKNPGHHFRHIGYDDPYPEAQCYLFFTVLLHVPDEELPKVIEKCKQATRVVVIETMDPQFRKGNGFGFHREVAQYIEEFQVFGWIVDKMRAEKLSHYPGWINCLAFKKP